MNTDEGKLVFLSEELKQRAVVMFCESEFIGYIGSHLDYTLMDLLLSAVEIRRLDKKQGESYKLVVSDDTNLLSWGRDFRGNGKGLTFL